jgi:XTP/dITP diphosphohydrolase
VDRHPHIYGDVEANDEETVKANWEKLKLKEGKKSVLEGVPKGLPSLVKAYRMQDKVRGVGFDWDNEHQVWDKVEEELAEFKAELDVNQERATDEFGDVLFALVNFARFKDINPDEALERTNRRFRNRFQFMENAINLADGKTLSDMTLAEMNEHWDAAKKALAEDEKKG